MVNINKTVNVTGLDDVEIKKLDDTIRIITWLYEHFSTTVRNDVPNTIKSLRDATDVLCKIKDGQELD